MAERVAVTHDAQKPLAKIKAGKYATLPTLDAQGHLPGRPRYTCEPGTVFVRAFAYARAISTGQEPQPPPGEQAKVQP